MSGLFWAGCSRLRCSIMALIAHQGYKWCRLTGGVKVDVKAQSHSKLYNGAEECTWQSRWWDSEEREGESGKWKKTTTTATKKKTGKHLCVCVCTYNKLHEFPVDCQNEAPAIKMASFCSPCTPITVAFIKRLSDTCGTTNNSQGNLQCCHALCSTYPPRGRQSATTAVKPSYLRHSTGDNLKQVSFVFPGLHPAPFPPELFLQ